MVSIAWHEILSWGVAIISLTLFIAERRKNDNTKYYMLLQGILRACYERAGFFASQYGRLNRDTNTEVSKDLYIYAAESIYVDYKALMEQIMGAMMALNPDKELPFDVMRFLRPDVERAENPSD